jgi:ribosomal protein S18 acetylase RimI-like enzyme
VYREHYTDKHMLRSYRDLYLGLSGTSPRTGEESRTIRRATPNDLSAVVTIHQSVFRHFFLTQLGANFLRRYYDLVLTYDLGILLVYEAEGSLRGFVCGFVDPPEFYQRMWSARLSLAIPVLSALVRHPALIGRVISGVRRVHSTASEWPPRSCELSSIAVAPASAGNGVGKALAESFLNEAKSLEARCVYLTTDADGNDAANAFYCNVGFERTRRFRQGGARWMNEYVLNGWEENRCRTLV